jgi:hypothetical protein
LLALLDLPFMVVEGRFKIQKLLEVGHIKLSLHVQLDHGFDISECQRHLSNLKHVQGVVEAGLELIEEGKLFWKQ